MYNTMKMNKLTCKKIKYFIKDEKKASKEYGQLGLKKLSRQEGEHYKFFKKEFERKCK